MIDRLPLEPHHREKAGQLMRFVVTGGFVTSLGVGVYALVALILLWNPQL